MSQLEGTVPHLTQSPDSARPPRYTEDRLAGGVYFDNPSGDRSFYFIQNNGEHGGTPYRYTGLNMRTQTDRTNRLGYNLLRVGEVESQGGTEHTVSLTAQVRPGVVVDVTYNQDGRTIGEERRACHPQSTQRPLFRVGELPEAIDRAATGRALIEQFEAGYFGKPALVLPAQR